MNMSILLLKNIVNEFLSVMPTETTLPPGFSPSDIQNPEDYVKKSVSEVNEPLLGKDDPSISPADMGSMLAKKKELGGKADHETPYIHRSTFTVVDEKGTEIDLDKLKGIITKRPDRILTQNSKLAKSGQNTYAFNNLTLPAYRGLWYDESAEEFKIVTTCPKAGMCSQICYARKGGYVQFPASFTFSAQVLNFLLNDWHGFKTQLSSEIKQAAESNNKKGRRRHRII